MYSRWKSHPATAPVAAGRRGPREREREKVAPSRAWRRKQEEETLHRLVDPALQVIDPGAGDGAGWNSYQNPLHWFVCPLSSLAHTVRYRVKKNMLKHVLLYVHTYVGIACLLCCGEVRDRVSLMLGLALSWQLRMSRNLDFAMKQDQGSGFALANLPCYVTGFYRHAGLSPVGLP